MEGCNHCPLLEYCMLLRLGVVEVFVLRMLLVYIHMWGDKDIDIEACIYKGISGSLAILARMSVSPSVLCIFAPRSDPGANFRARISCAYSFPVRSPELA